MSSFVNFNTPQKVAIRSRFCQFKKSWWRFGLFLFCFSTPMFSDAKFLRCCSVLFLCVEVTLTHSALEASTSINVQTHQVSPLYKILPPFYPSLFRSQSWRSSVSFLAVITLDTPELIDMQLDRPRPPTDLSLCPASKQHHLPVLLQHECMQIHLSTLLPVGVRRPVDDFTATFWTCVWRTLAVKTPLCECTLTLTKCVFTE